MIRNITKDRSQLNAIRTKHGFQDIRPGRRQLSYKAQGVLMMEFRKITRIAVVALFNTMTASAWAQKDAGAIVGVVRDESGAVVAAAKVTVTDVDRGSQVVVSTNEAGEYVASPL